MVVNWAFRIYVTYASIGIMFISDTKSRLIVMIKL